MFGCVIEPKIQWNKKYFLFLDYSEFDLCWVYWVTKKGIKKNWMESKEEIRLRQLNMLVWSPWCEMFWIIFRALFFFLQTEYFCILQTEYINHLNPNLFFFQILSGKDYTKLSESYSFFFSTKMGVKKTMLY